MTAAVHDEPIILSYVRDPAEQVQVMRLAGRRFSSRGNRMSVQTRWGIFLLSAIAAGAGSVIFFHLYRLFFLIPMFGAPLRLDDGDVTIIWLIPSLLLLVGVAIYSRLATRRRFAAMQARIRPDVVVTVMVTPEGASWTTTHSSVWLGWPEIAAIVDFNGQILFELESFVSFIPASAFANGEQRTAILRQILSFWQAGRTAKP
jgi:hypothetical protein